MNAPDQVPGRRVFLAPGLARNDLSVRLKRAVQGEVLFDRGTRARYATDASIYQVEPIGVVVPRTEDDARAAIDVARELSTPILPRGAGSSQCGQTVGAALVIDNSKWLRDVVEFDRDRRTVVVQPGITLDALNAWLKPHGLWYPVDVSTSAQATLGGMAGNNSCGSRSIEYGNMVHNVAGIDAVLADGTQAYFGTFADAASGGDMSIDSQRLREIVSGLHALAERERDEIRRVWPTVMRRVGGYNLDIFEPRSERPYTRDGSLNLAHLLIGSEGTLAYFRRLKLRLSSLPRNRVLGVVNFPTFHGAMDSAQHLVKLGPTAVELVDRTMIDLARANPAFRPVIDRALSFNHGEPQAILLTEFTGATQAESLGKLARLVELMGDLGLPGSVVELTDEKAQKELWEVRKAGLNIMMSMRGDGKPVSFIEDCAVPLEHLAAYTASLTEIFRKHGTRGTWYAHASVGTLHVRPVLDMRQDGAQKMRAIAEEAAEHVRRYKGAFSGEHGDGLVRSEWVAWQFGPRLTRAFEQVKDLFDPDGLMNPGKIVRASRMDDATLFRFKPGYAPLPMRPALDWSAFNVETIAAQESWTGPGTGKDPSGGFAKAVEMCNNNGHCRKFDAGTMCPSYRVTRDEQHLTRGRANTLRLALSGQLGHASAAEALTSEPIKAALDLCVSCKGCKRDCPTGVDMARMKIEARHQNAVRFGPSLRDRLVAYLPRYAPWVSRVPGVANLRNGWRLLRVLGERWVGFAADRSLPAWAPQPFLRSDAARAASAATAHASPGSADVVLFVDTFTNYFEPENGAAALTVLLAAGRRVHVARPAPSDANPHRPLCCGRTFLAAGLVDQAREEAKRLLDAVAPFVERGVPVVGLEPSCLLTLRDEFLVLGLDERARRTADAAYLLAEYLERESRAGRLDLALNPLPHARALVHGHCHEKAFDALRPVLTVLGWIPGLKVESIESSCCGMAGSFGYEAEHHAMSLQMAELSLLPAVRQADAETLLVADGTSCRHQVADGTGRQARHVARVLARALASRSSATRQPFS